MAHETEQKPQAKALAKPPVGWYVLRAVSGKEAKVKEYIDAGINTGIFKGHVKQALIPTEKVKTMRGNKQVVKERLYLPGYVLVEAQLYGDTIHDLCNVPNSLGFLGGMLNPTPMRESEVARILGKVDELEAEPLEVEIPYEIGENVKVIDGPFAGFSGVVDKVDDDKKKVTVIVKVFGRSTGLDLGFMQIEKE